MNHYTSKSSDYLLTHCTHSYGIGMGDCFSITPYAALASVAPFVDGSTSSFSSFFAADFTNAW